MIRTTCFIIFIVFYYPSSLQGLVSIHSFSSYKCFICPHKESFIACRQVHLSINTNVHCPIPIFSHHPSIYSIQPWSIPMHHLKQKSCRHVYKHRWNCFVMLRLQHVMFTLLLKNNSGAGGCWQVGLSLRQSTIYINRSSTPHCARCLIEIDDLTYQDGRDEPYNTSKDFTLVFLKKNEVLQMERERES